MNSGANSGGSADAASPLGDRYRVVRELGRGSFGQTYLAEDLHRYKELCVIKEFIPQIEDQATLHQAKDLFEREANTLYQLGHKQIPEFRQLLQVETETGGRLFLVQDYVEGSTYQQLLQSRQNFGGRFNETEITQLLYQILPVLSYIHSLGVIHRDISPDNIIARRDDGLPVLIDFGSIKEIAADVRSQLSIEHMGESIGEGINSAVTSIGKVGYVPPEQQNTGTVDPTSDLYGLAATLLVLANGQDPQALHDTFQGTWSGFDVLSPKLGAVLEKMLQPEPTNRFQSAEEVLAALSSRESSYSAAQNAPAVGSNALYPPVGTATPADTPQTVFDEHMHSEAIAYEDTAVVPISAVGGRSVDPEDVSSTYETTLAEANVHEPDITEDRERREERQALIPLLIMLGTLGALLLFAWFRLRRPAAPVVSGTPGGNLSETVSNPGGFSLEETARRQDIRTRRDILGLSENTFNRLVDQLFYAKYPILSTSGPNGGRKALTANPADEPLRIRWDELALNLLSTFEGNFSARSLQGLGSYSENDRARWQSDVNSANVGTRALYDLADAKFLRLFPEQAGQDFLEQPIGQVYYAIADDRARAIADGSARATVNFTNGLRQEFDRRLPPGDGRIYLLDLTSGQNLRLNIDAPTDSTLLSLYRPATTEDNPSVFDDSEQTTWAGSINESGDYELVVVNTSDAPIDYQLAVSVDNVTTAPPVAPEREELPPILPEESEESDEPENETTVDEESTERDNNITEEEQAQ